VREEKPGRLRVLASVVRNMIWLSGEMLNVGDIAPGFEVLDHTGKTRRLSDYRGKTVILWFYPKAGTPG
jgi:peroxiredoxin